MIDAVHRSCSIGAKALIDGDMAPTGDLYCYVRQQISGEETERVKYRLPQRTRSR
jgi:hypothetical protein